MKNKKQKTREEELLDQLCQIAKEEYRKLIETCPNILDPDCPEFTVHAYTRLNTDLVGVSYWHGTEGSGYVYELKKYNLIGSNEKTFYSFDTLEDAEKYLRKSKVKGLQNPFMNSIEIKYCGYSSLNPEQLHQLALTGKDLKVVKTVIEQN